jgi:hypothetical protein
MNSYELLIAYNLPHPHKNGGEHKLTDIVCVCAQHIINSSIKSNDSPSIQQREFSGKYVNKFFSSFFLLVVAAAAE